MIIENTFYRWISNKIENFIASFDTTTDAIDTFIIALKESFSRTKKSYEYHFIHRKEMPF
jgi:hypothetical protein